MQSGVKEGEYTCDVIVVGSGGGLAGALTARSRGLDTLVVEKTQYIGGSTALSGGTWWAPCNPLLAKAGVVDTFENASTYLEEVVGDAGPSTSRARKEAYITGGLTLFDLLEAHGVGLDYSDGWPDYYTELPGGVARGRTIHCKAFDARRLGALGDWLRPTRLFLAAHSVEVGPLALGKRTWRTLKISARVITRSAWAKVRGIRLLTRGQSLVGQLILACAESGVETWRNTEISDLLVEDGRVVGVVAMREGELVKIRCRHGVLLAAGGFSHDQEMRGMYQPQCASAAWTMASPGDTGEVLRAAVKVGAATDLMDESWWVPGTLPPTGVMLHVWDRCFPHSLMVDGTGVRFTNEAAPYMEVGQAMLRRHLTVPALPSWLILESRHRQRYAFGLAPPRLTPREWFDSGYMKRAATIKELAEQCGLPADVLMRTISRFNAAVRDGRDADFGRGETAIEGYYGDRRSRPNSNLGEVTRPPFYAVAIYPGDVGTCGGLVTDANAQVLDQAGHPISGLYAAGNITASVMGRTYPGAGASIGASMVFSHLGAEHMANNPVGAKNVRQ